MRRTQEEGLFFWAAQLVALFVLWLLFVAKLELAESLIGLAAALLATTAAAVLRRQKFARFAPRWLWLRQAWRLPCSIIYDTFIILLVLLRRLGGKRASSRTLAVNFSAGGTDGQSVARRALAIGLATISPNTIVIAVDERKKLLLAHQLKAQGVSTLIKELGGK